jgi:glycosyltransferase involved in cell wall biosynthesis
MYKKILIITDNLQDQINGVVTTFKNLEKHAVLDDYRIIYLDPGQFVHFSCPGYPEVKLSIPWLMGKKIKEISPDYIHIATEGPIGLAARLWLDMRGWRYNTSYHTKFPEFIKEIYHIPKVFTWSYLRWFHKHSGRVLVTTETIKNSLIERKFKSDIITWTRGVDREALEANQTFERKNPPTVLYVGRISKEKNLDDLCVLQDKYNIEIVGDGPYRQHLESKYTKVSFLGYQQGTELANSYARADVFCFPSKNDTFGIVIIEAMSLGTPVAAYPIDGPIDIIEPDTGHMSNDLDKSIQECMKLNRETVREKSKKWTWKECWKIFKCNLIEII